MSGEYPYEAKATLKYKAPPGSPDPISFQPAETITVLSQADDDGDWLRGRTSEGVEGVFPASFVVKVSSGAATQDETTSAATTDAASSPPAAAAAAAPAVASPTASSPPPKPSSLKDRIAFLNQQGSAAPPPKPKPAFAKRSVVSPPPPSQQPAPSQVASAPLAEMAPTTTSTSEEAGAGMSAADAAASISKGGSLRDRIAALQAQQAAMAGEKPVAPPKPAGKVWKRPPAPPQPEAETAEDDAEGAKGAAAAPPPQPERSASLVSTTSDVGASPTATATQAQDAIQPADKVDNDDAATDEPVELSEEQAEAKRKEELRNRMAALSGSAGGSQMGMGGVKMPALPKRTAGPQRKKKEAAAAPTAPEVEPEAPVAEKPDESETTAEPSVQAEDAAPAQEEEKPSSPIAPPPIPSLAARQGNDDDEEEERTHKAVSNDDDDDDFETPSLPPGAAGSDRLPPPVPTGRPPSITEAAGPTDAVEKDEAEEKEELAEESPASPPSLPPGRPPIPAPRPLDEEVVGEVAEEEEELQTQQHEEEEDDKSEGGVAMPAGILPPPLPTGRPPLPSGPPPIPMMATRAAGEGDDQDTDRPLREIPPVPAPATVATSRNEEAEEADTALDTSEPKGPIQRQVEDAEPASAAATAADAPPDEDEEEDPEVARRRAIAARMAKLGGRAGPMMGMPPPFGAPMPPRKQRSVDPSDAPTSPVVPNEDESKADEERAAPAPPRRIPGVPTGGILMPGFIPPVRKSVDEDEPPLREELSTEQTPVPPETADTKDDLEASRDEAEDTAATETPSVPATAPPPLPPGRPAPGLGAADDEIASSAEAPARSLPPPPPIVAATSYSEEPDSNETAQDEREEQDDEAQDRVPTPPSRRPSTQLPPLPSGSPVRAPAAGAAASLTKRGSIASIGSTSRKGSIDIGRRSSVELPPLQPAATAGSCKAVMSLGLEQEQGWWTQQPFTAPRSISQRQDLTFEANVNKITKRGKTSYDNELDIVFDDLSRVIVSVSFADDDPSNASVSEEAFGPPAYPSVDVLMRLSTTLGAQIFAAAHSKLSEKARDLTPAQFIDLCYSRAPDAVPPIAQSFYGLVVFAVRSSSSQQQQKYEQDEPRAGDVAVFENVKIKHGLSTTKVGLERPHVAVVASWDSKKRKLHTIEVPAGGGAVGEEGYRVDDIKSGECKVFRVVDKAWLDTASPIARS